ncbi:MAG: DUF4298 domain-containing protein [Lachnospiraceae bacterium]|nr:DUF4298 domain-containing protein [Lachnospiraceae bacterium]
MPKIFRDLCLENGIEMQVTMLTKAGMGFDYHAENEQTRFNILYGDYDFIILQHVAHPMGDYGVMEAGADRIMEWIRQTNAVPCYFMTWTEEDNEAFQPEMAARYRKLATKHNCLVAPVGERWWEEYHKDPSTDLYYTDRQHASLTGSRLAAETIFETLRPEQIARITRYEQMLQKAEYMIREGPEDPDALRDLIAELEAYYTSDEWKKDFADDEAGLLPGNLKRGVLSEDGIHNLLSEYYEHDER